MKSTFISILFTFFSIHSFAQLSEQDAVLRYEKAAELFQANKYHDCAIACNNLMDSMRKATPKVLYLYIRSIYENYTNSNDASETKFKSNYKTFTEWLTKCDQFFGTIDQAKYPKEKYDDILKAKTYFSSKQKEFEYEKNRTPQDAIAFLNECADKFKFAYKVKSNVVNQCVYLKYSLDDYILTVRAVRYDNNKNNYKNYRFIRSFVTLISFKNTIEIGKPKNSRYPSPNQVDENQNNSYDYFKNNDNFILGDYTSGLNSSNSNFVEFYSNAIHFIDSAKQVKRDLDISIDTVFHGKLTSMNGEYKLNTITMSHFFNGRIKTAEDYTWIYAPYGFYIFSYMDTNNPEFIKGNYEKRIRDAFQYLIDYFPKFPKEEVIQKEVVKPKF